MKQSIRIIGGNYRGKKLSFADVEGLRPTPDRVRETLFNWLMHDIRDARCLDAFAGSGALGFEAFSRGAAKVVLVEKNPKACQCLEKNVQQFQSDQLALLKMDVCSYLAESKEVFDIIFLDPPFSSNLMEQSIKGIETSQRLRTKGLLYTESGHPLSLDETLWEPLKFKRAGQVYYALFQKK